MTRNRLDPNKVDVVSLKHSSGLIDEWRTSNAASVSYLSKHVLNNVVPLVQELRTCTELLSFPLYESRLHIVVAASIRNTHHRFSLV